MPIPFEGGCRCGAVRYRCSVAPAAVVHCYCRDCQYSSGGACSTVLVVTDDDVVITGTPASHSVRADSGEIVSRSFCATCGTPLFAQNPQMSTLRGIKAATLDDPSWLEPTAHIWTDSAPPWACMSDGLTKFARNSGAS